MNQNNRTARRGLPRVGAVLALLIVVFLRAAPLSGARNDGFSLLARAGYFIPADAVFREIYGRGVAWGGEFDAALSPRLSLWVGVDYFSRAGLLLYTREETTLRVVPLQAGLKIGFDLGPAARAYAGAGPAWFQYRESNSIATLKKSALGFIGRLGVRVDAGQTFFFDFGGAYSLCRVNPAGVEADLGGWLFSAGAGFRF